MHPVSAAIRASGYSDAKVARHLGLTPPAMSDRMRGRTRWTLSEAIAIARLLHMPVDELVSWETPVDMLPVVTS